MDYFDLKDYQQQWEEQKLHPNQALILSFSKIYLKQAQLKNLNIFLLEELLDLKQHYNFQKTIFSLTYHYTPMMMKLNNPQIKMFTIIHKWNNLQKNIQQQCLLIWVHNNQSLKHNLQSPNEPLNQQTHHRKRWLLRRDQLLSQSNSLKFFLLQY